jgi:hypothetical protein
MTASSKTLITVFTVFTTEHLACCIAQPIRLSQAGSSDDNDEDGDSTHTATSILLVQ